jgi:hypothetical protein
MNNFRKLIAVAILLTGVFMITLSVKAFKPTVADYGHTSITQKVIGDNGYPAGYKAQSIWVQSTKHKAYAKHTKHMGHKAYGSGLS